MLTNSQLPKKLFNDPSLWLLLFSNLVTIFFATKGGWNLSTIIWIYWFQSITIGFFHFIRILQLKEFSTEGFKINGQSVRPTKGTKNFTAFFFLLRYGLLHFGFLIFFVINTFSPFGTGNSDLNLMIPPFVSSLVIPPFADIKLILITALLFFVNHLFSYFYNKPRDTKKQNIGTLMFYPYARIIPMHLTMVLGSSFIGVLPSFLILKTFSDALMHILQHKVISKGEEREV